MTLALNDGQKLALNLSCEKNCWCVDCELLDVHATGNTLEMAMVDFAEQLNYFHWHYTELPDKKCLKHALELKQLYQTMFNITLDVG
jgi:hypothetical protein